MARGATKEIDAVEVGEVFRDTYYDGKLEACTKRTIKVLAVFRECLRAETLTDVRGNPPKGKGRQTEISFKTLRAGYVRVSKAKGKA